MSALASYAANPQYTHGRIYPESSGSTIQGIEVRNAFQRDRDRIIHSTAFRRLEYKTQVFVNHEGDLFRTRLTHSLEVAQIARGIARVLQLHEDLTEAIALAHDLGHTPFGHAGQDALNACMKDYGGFEHNLQSLRVVDKLEQRYADFDGLNLTFELREGILKHCSVANACQLGDVGQRFLEKTQPSLEAQLTNFADEIAYNNHDVDDGLRSGLIALDQLAEVELFAEQLAIVKKQYPDLQDRRLVSETVRRMINALVIDICTQSLNNINEKKPQTIEDVRQNPPMIAFSASMQGKQAELKRFLRKNLYQHEKVTRMTQEAEQIVQDLFQVYCSDLSLLPAEYQRYAQEDSHRAVADYIAGMTDRFAIKEHRKLCGAS